MPRRRDSERLKVYRAELELKRKAPIISQSECLMQIFTICNDESLTIPKIKFPSKGTRAYASAYIISLPPWACSKLIICHEMAHVYACQKIHTFHNPIVSHGKEFCETYIKYVNKYIDQNTALELTIQLVANKVMKFMPALKDTIAATFRLESEK